MLRMLNCQKPTKIKLKVEFEPWSVLEDVTLEEHKRGFQKRYVHLKIQKRGIFNLLKEAFLTC